MVAYSCILESCEYYKTDLGNIRSRHGSMQSARRFDGRHDAWSESIGERVYHRTRRLGSNLSEKCMQPTVTENENIGRPLLSSSPKIPRNFGPRLMVFLVVGPLINTSSLHPLSKRTLSWTVTLLRKLCQFALLQLLLLHQSFLSQMLVSQSSGK